MALLAASLAACGSAQPTLFPDGQPPRAGAAPLAAEAAVSIVSADSALPMPGQGDEARFLDGVVFDLGLSSGLRQGDPLFITVSLPGPRDFASPTALAALGLSVRLRYANGALSPLAPLVALPPRPRREPSRGGKQLEGAGPSARPEAPSAGPLALGFAALGIATGAPSGPAQAMLLLGDRLLAEKGFVIGPRQFQAQTIRLDQGLTSLRSDPDPRKTEQAERYLRLIATVDPAAVFLNEGFVRPVAGNRRTSLFGDRRRYQYYGGGEAFSEHAGIDYGYPVGTPIRAAGRGRVVMAEDRIVTGLTLVIEHLPGVYTIYMHLSRMDAAVGDLVERAAAIGLLGATGLATGPHLHWELRVLGVASDPEAWIGIDKVPYIRTINATIEGR